MVSSLVVFSSAVRRLGKCRLSQEEGVHVEPQYNDSH